MGNGQKLNVILHGTFAYVDKKGVNFIDALIPLPHPEDGMDHVFRAGNWLGETELRPGTYKLEGVQTGNAHLDHGKNIIFQNGCPRRPRNPQREYARIIFPRPEKISSLRISKVRLKVGNQNWKEEHGAALQVFTYAVKNDSDLRLQRVDDADENKPRSGHYWEPVFTGDYASLQIFSAEDHPDNPTHTGRAFQRISALLGVTSIKVQVHRAGGIEAKDLPPGIIAEETEDLAVRTIRMARLGRLRRQKADLDQAWFGNEALDGNPPGCVCDACN